MATVVCVTRMRSRLKNTLAVLLMASASTSLFGYASGTGTELDPYILTSTDSGLSGGYYFEAISDTTVGTVIQISNGTSPQTNYLYVRTNGVTLTNSGMRISYVDGNTAYVYVSNGATIDGSGGSISTGFKGTGTLDISGASTVKFGSGASYVAYNANAVGTVNVRSGSSFTGSGTLHLGYNASSSGTLNVDGSGSTTTAAYLYVGGTGTGAVHLSNGGSLSTSSESILGRNSGSSGTVTIASGAHWNAAGLTIASAASSTGIVTVDGAGSYIKDSSLLSVGPGGTGTLTITDGALVTVGGTLSTGTNGVIQLNDGYLALKSDSLLSSSDIASTYHFEVYDGSSYVAATSSDLQTEYFTTNADWQNSTLYSTYSSLDLTGYTLIYAGAVPEPAAFAFIGGLAALGFVVRQKRRQ